MQISLNKAPENQKAVGGLRKYLAGKCCVHSELSPHDPGKINLCGGKYKEWGPLQGTSDSLEAQNPAAILVGRKILKGNWEGQCLFFMDLRIILQQENVSKHV